MQTINIQKFTVKGIAVRTSNKNESWAVEITGRRVNSIIYYAKASR